MDKTESNTNSTANTKCNYPVDVGTAGREDSSQLHSTTQESPVSDSRSTSGFQNSIMNENFKRTKSVTLPAKSNPPVPDRRPVTKSRSASENNFLNGVSRSVNKLPINKWTYLDSSRSSSLSSSPVNAISKNETDTPSDIQGGMNYHLYESISPLTTKKIILPVCVNKTANVSVVQSSTDNLSNRTPEEDTGVETKCHAFFPSDRTKDFQDISKPVCETTDGIDSRPTLKFSELEICKITTSENEERKELKEIRTSFTTDEEYGPSDNQSLKSFESRLSSPDSEESKVEMHESNEENIGDASFLDDAWMNYVERPLLPLKPLQKQKSLSCTNLVQTIKGLSKRKTSANNRFLSPENTFVQSQEICTSEASIPNVCRRKQSEESGDHDVRRVSDVDESFSTKNIRQSLQYYPWYHSVDPKEGSKRLLNMHQNGAFLIRPASNPTSEILHTLCVVFSGRVYNFYVKNLKDGRITLGKKNEQKETFSSLLDMIKYHQTVPISINFASQVAHVHLLITPAK